MKSPVTVNHLLSITAPRNINKLLLTYTAPKTAKCCNQTEGRTGGSAPVMFQGGEGEEPDCSAIILRIFFVYLFILLKINVTTFKYQRTFFFQVTQKSHKREKWVWILLISIICTRRRRRRLYAPLTSAFGTSKGVFLLEKLAIRCSCNRVCCPLHFLLWSCSGTQSWWSPEPNPYCVYFSESLVENINSIYIMLCWRATIAFQRFNIKSVFTHLEHKRVKIQCRSLVGLILLQMFNAWSSKKVF